MTSLRRWFYSWRARRNAILAVRSVHAFDYKSAKVRLFNAAYYERQLRQLRRISH